MASETENIAHGEAPVAATAGTAQQDEVLKAHTLSSLGRQSSIYSLTLDEFQSTLENGKNFGSMNMDEFLNNIWTAEENQAMHEEDEPLTSNQNDSTAAKPLQSQSSLPRQGSLTLPAPLCRKTVEEVWSEIHKNQQQQQQQQQQPNPGTTQRQPTFGEMTLEDFLIKAGVVRESCAPSSTQRQLQPPQQPPLPAPSPQHFGLYQSNTTTAVDPNYAIGTVMNLGFSDHRNTGNGVPGSIQAYQTYSQSASVVGESSSFASNGGKRNSGYPGGVVYSGGVRNGGAFGVAQTLGMGSPASPVSSDGMCANQMDGSGSQFGLEMGGGMRGRKRIIDGPVEKVVERRQRRMIKNRESAARSRARKQKRAAVALTDKQAYTVELEAELNQLKEENAHLKRALAETEKKRRQELQEEMREKLQTKTQKTSEKLRMLRRTVSSPW